MFPSVHHILGDWGGGGECHRGEEEYAVKVQEVEEDREKDQFTSVLSTLSWLQPESPVVNFTVGCR